MPADVFVVAVPQLGVNDDTAMLVAWYVQDGARVAVDDVLCTVETAKAAYEVAAETAGLLARLADEGAEIKVTQPIALIGDDAEALAAAKKRHLDARVQATTGVAGDDGLKATDKARALAAELGVDLAALAVEGIIQEKHVRAAVEQDEPERPDPADLFWNPFRRPVAIYGAGRGGVTVKECLENDADYEVVCFVDDDPRCATQVAGLPVFHVDALEGVVRRGVSYVAPAIAAGPVRLRIREQCAELGLKLVNAIHPRATLSPTVQLGCGNFIKAGAVVETRTVVGDCCIIDNGAIVAHDNVLEDGCHLAPGATLGSGIRVGRAAIVGTGAAVATGVTIGAGAIISVGAAVVKDVPDGAVIEGVPGRVVGKRRGF